MYEDALSRLQYQGINDSAVNVTPVVRGSVYG